jgi:hypothetical protein
MSGPNFTDEKFIMTKTMVWKNMPEAYRTG